MYLNYSLSTEVQKTKEYTGAENGYEHLLVFESVPMTDTKNRSGYHVRDWAHAVTVQAT